VVPSVKVKDQGWEPVKDTMIVVLKPTHKVCVPDMVAVGLTQTAKDREAEVLAGQAPL
jgi:hypothetical protein